MVASEGQPKKSKVAQNIVIAGVAGLLVFYAFCTVFYVNTGGPATASRPKKTYEELLAESKPARALEYQDDANWKRGEYGNIFIAGTVKNESAKSYRYAQISFNLLDKNGNQIGNAFANVTGLEPGRAWKFEAVVAKTDGLHTFEFHEVKGW